MCPLGSVGTRTCVPPQVSGPLPPPCAESRCSLPRGVCSVELCAKAQVTRMRDRLGGGCATAGGWMRDRSRLSATLRGWIRDRAGDLPWVCWMATTRPSTVPIGWGGHGLGGWYERPGCCARAGNAGENPDSRQDAGCRPSAVGVASWGWAGGEIARGHRDHRVERDHDSVSGAGRVAPSTVPFGR